MACAYISAKASLTLPASKRKESSRHHVNAITPTKAPPTLYLTAPPYQKYRAQRFARARASRAHRRRHNKGARHCSCAGAFICSYLLNMPSFMIFFVFLHHNNNHRGAKEEEEKSIIFFSIGISRWRHRSKSQKASSSFWSG